MFVCTARGFGLFQFFNKEVVERAEQMQTRVATHNKVVAVGVNLLAEQFSSLNVGFAHFGKVAEMHVVVGRSVNEQQVAVERIGTLNGVRGITGSVFGRGAHVAFGIYRVVVFPVGRSSYGNTGAEHIAAFAHRHEGVETTKAPAPNGNAVFVDVGQ